MIFIINNTPTQKKKKKAKKIHLQFNSTPSSSSSSFKPINTHKIQIWNLAQTLPNLEPSPSLPQIANVFLFFLGASNTK